MADDQIPTAEELVKTKKFPVKYVVALLFMAALIGGAIFISLVVL